MRKATAAQVDYLTNLSRACDEDEALLVSDITDGRHHRFEDLTMQEASELIDYLREQAGMD